ncbi:hypothetical protein AAG906_027246 [Vitis piasezkii]
MASLSALGYLGWFRPPQVQGSAFLTSHLSFPLEFPATRSPGKRRWVPHRAPVIVSPKAVFRLRNSQTCLDPDASRSVLGIILGGGQRLYPLTKKRASLRFPWGRLIDIPIYVLTQFNSLLSIAIFPASNMGGYKNEGFVEVLAAQQSPENPNWFQHTEKLMLISLWPHCQWMKRATAFGLMKIDEEGRIIEFAEKPRRAIESYEAKEMPYIASMGIYVVSKDVMLDLLGTSFLGPMILEVQAYLYGYWEDIGTIEAFITLIWGSQRSRARFQLLRPILSNLHPTSMFAPSKMLDADVTDSVIGEGCVIKNCKIHHSVVGLRSCISETDADRRFLMAKGSVQLVSVKLSHQKGDHRQECSHRGQCEGLIMCKRQETDGYFIKSGIVTVIKDALLPSGTII